MTNLIDGRKYFRRAQAERMGEEVQRALGELLCSSTPIEVTIWGNRLMHKSHRLKTIMQLLIEDSIPMKDE